METFQIVWITGAITMFIYSMVKWVANPQNVREVLKKNDIEFSVGFVVAVMLWGSLLWPVTIADRLARGRR